MKTGRVFTISVLLNLALAGWALWWLVRSRGGAVAEERSAVPAASAPRVVGDSPPASNAPVAITYQTNHFHWPQIETNDFVQLALNLRALGCPEKTVRDLVNARAVRALERLIQSTGPKLPFWTAGLQRERAHREAEREVLAAVGKIITSVEAALGPGSFPPDSKLTDDFVEQAVVRFLSGPMSEETFSRLRTLFARQDFAREKIRTVARGVMLEADEQALEQQNRQVQAELAAIFSPAELEEFTARLGIFKMADEVRFEATDLTQAEIRQVGLMRGRLSFVRLDGWFDGQRLSDEQEAQFTSDLRQFLGAARYAQVERAADDDFKRLFDLSRDNQLPQETAVKAFELRQLTAREVAALRADPALAAAERQQRLAAVQAETQAAMLQLLGATAWQAYLQHSGSWLTNVSGL